MHLLTMQITNCSLRLVLHKGCFNVSSAAQIVWKLEPWLEMTSPDLYGRAVFLLDSH